MPTTAPDMTVINMNNHSNGVMDHDIIPLETRPRQGSTAVSLKMHDDEEDDEPEDDVINGYSRKDNTN